MVVLTREQAVDLLVRVARAPKEKVALIAAFGVHINTYRRWEKRCSTDAALAELVKARTEETEPDWVDLAQTTMRRVLDTMAILAARLQSKKFSERGDIRELAGAAKIVGELLTAQGVLNVGTIRTTRKDTQVSKDAGQGSGGSSRVRTDPSAAPEASSGRDPVH
jgi:hypothetical protein